MTTLSLAAMARMSAQETTPGQTFTTADLMASMTSNPLAEPLLGVAIFSPWKLGVSSSNSEASQPYTMIDHIIIKHIYVYIYNIITSCLIVLVITN